MLYPVTKNWTNQYPGYMPDYYPFHIAIVDASASYAHRHEYLEFSLVVEGEGMQRINGVDYPMRPGTFTLLMPYHIHQIMPSGRSIRLYNCMFDIDFLSQSSAGLKDLHTRMEEGMPTLDLSECESQFSAFETIAAEMVQEYKDGDMWKNDMLKIRLSELLIRFDRLRRQEKEQSAGAGGERSDSGSIWPIIHYVSTHFHEPLSQAKVAARFGISSPYLSSAFKKVTGLNFVRFLHEVRIRQACSLLASTTMSNIEIAVEVGFASPQSFVRAFREVKQLTPTEYRKRLLSGEPVVH
ncbi:MAG: AraC family transcriptional regulator [Paenibacillus sp.]|jgi:AraC-like DNA-binding protein|nr:AraC family transcriptional regulator [Paenibacillus sp.]